MRMFRIAMMTLVFAAVGLAMPDVATGQPAPFGVRNTVIVTEIAPNAHGAEAPWIELFNPLDSPAAVAKTVFKTGEGESFEVPVGFPALPAGAYVVVRFDGPAHRATVETPRPDLLVIHVPSSLAPAWIPSRGELAVLQPDPATPGELRLIDYVAWGAPGANWSQTKKRLARWSAGSFVPLAEGFGVYDPAATLPPGGSIGLYPRSTTSTAEDWVIFDRDETSAGAKNHVPRPKAFTLPDGAEIGGQSFGVGWARRKGDEWYRFQLAADPDFDRIVVDERCTYPRLRMGEALADGWYFFRVEAYLADLRSQASHVKTVLLATTACDWPMPPTPWYANPVKEWLTNPGCTVLPKCNVVSSIQFKFQRKDTNLVCLEGCKTGQQGDIIDCPWDAPHPYCEHVTFSEGRPSSLLCAGGPLSRTCGSSWSIPLATAVLLPVRDLSSMTILETVRLIWPPSPCDHGDFYCGMASVSMMASAYGPCLSQDRIAYHLRGSLAAPPPGGDLAHAITDMGGISCWGPQDSAQADDECSLALMWALGFGDADMKRNPNLSTPSGQSFTAAYFIGSSAVTFADFVKWIDEQRPIMTSDGSHISVVSGYCESDGTGWVYVYDPVVGPQARKFDAWWSTIRGAWVGPPVGAWPPASTPDLVRWDEQGVWNDADLDGLVDFDEVVRFGTDPGNMDTYGTGATDKEFISP